MTNELWKNEKTWKTIRESYRLMKMLKVKTQFIQSAYSECWVAWKLNKAGYDVRFHPKDCDVSINAASPEQSVRFEIKHSEDNKGKYANGHGYSSWRISKPQVKEGKFDLCLLLRDSLRGDEPDVTYVFTREEIANTIPIFDEGEKVDYYLWYSEYFEEIRKKEQWMNKAANSLVESLNKNPYEFERRWQLIVDGKLQDALELAVKLKQSR